MTMFSTELFKKLDVYEQINQVKETNVIFNDCLKYIPKHLQSFTDNFKVKFDESTAD